MGIPSGYRELLYIQSTGSQYIDTGYKITSENMRVVVQFAYTGDHSNSTLFGSETSGVTGSGEYSICPWGPPQFFVGGSKALLAAYTPEINENVTLDIQANNGILTEIWNDSVQNQQAYVTQLNQALNIFIFGNNISGAISQSVSMRLYRFKLYDSGNLVRDFYPCANAIGIAGLYDVIGNQFYVSATSTPFWAGPYAHIKTGDILNYAYTGSVQSVILPKGIYKLECWGAQGGYRSSATYGGKGGYSVGAISLDEETELFIYVGGSGNTGKTNGGFNGGGKRQSYNGGGGATDIRIGQDDLLARVIVAGGGGSDGATNKTGMYGGGETGGSTTENYGSGGFGGAQTGVSSSSWQTTSQSTSVTSQSGAYAGFGFGGNGIYRSSGYGGAGGGGWYGGSGSYPDGSGDDDRGGAGGSGYVYMSTTAANYPSGCLLTSKYYLEDAQTIAGNASMPNTDGSTETGHSGDGYARITAIKVNSIAVSVKVGNVWKQVESVYAKINGVWKPAETLYTKIGGVWKENS